ncbi:MAG: hypothetical protein IIU83_07325 [Fibrobacteraceae bacterium]|nr:hypothetical protein [Fibrobacteraceae bacterium]
MQPSSSASDSHVTPSLLAAIVAFRIQCSSAEQSFNLALLVADHTFAPFGFTAEPSEYVPL